MCKESLFFCNYGMEGLGHWAPGSVANTTDTESVFSGLPRRDQLHKYSCQTTVLDRRPCTHSEQNSPSPAVVGNSLAGTENDNLKQCFNLNNLKLPEECAQRPQQGKTLEEKRNLSGPSAPQSLWEVGTSAWEGGQGQQTFPCSQCWRLNV